jgi:hypothetical protein
MRKLLLLITVLFATLSNAATITVGSPNGGEIWAGCTVHNITWSGSATSGFYTVEYSTDGGTSWTSLATNLNATSYSWTVPNTTSSNCLVRVFDFNTPATVDQSNLAFTITAPLILTSPNGGEVWQVGGPTHNITWAASGTGTYLTIEYSTNLGANWTTITTTAVATSGTYTWTIPNFPSTQCLVRIKDNNTPCMTDVSDNLFTISPPTHVITVTAPNTAVNWYVYQAYNITWTSAYLTSSNVMLEYSIDNGGSWITIIASTSNTGSYSWTIPNTPSNQCLVRVSEVGLPATNDVSDVNFTIAPPVITVTSPNTAVTWYVGNNNTITWSNTVLSGSNVKLDYSIDGGSSWLPIVASVANTNSYNWVVPNNPSTTCRVRVSDALTPTTFDISNVDFTIALPYIQVVAPNGSENWNGCSVQNITWTKAGTTNNVKIEYSLNGGSSWTTIISSVANSGSYSWNVVPNTPSNNCLIRITDVSVPATTDISNAAFNITQNTAIVINTPNGGETWQVGGPTQAITWAASGTSASLTLEYSIDGGTNWIYINTVTASTSTYNWTIPNNPSTNCLVRLTDPSNPCKFDVSNAVFTISPPTHVITVTAPNTAVTYYVANVYNITWSSAYVTSPFVAIDYSTDGGSSWITVTASTNNTGSYSWTVPNTPSNQCLVRVSEYGTPSVFDISNVNFTIAPPFIQVSTPNGGESYPGCSIQNITWTRGGTTNNVKIEYSLNGGGSWNTIISSVSNTGSYSWNVVPNSPSGNCLIRITDVSSPATTDVSNGTFTITQNTAIIVTSPNGGQIWQVGGPTQNITWAASGTSTNLTLEYSIDNGTSWISIASVLASSGSYTWTIPNNPSTTCLVRLTDQITSCKFDVSDAVFTISPPTHVITVTAPNTAVTYYVANTYNITWTSAYLTSPFVVIDYSTDNGATWISITASTNNTGSYSWVVPNTPSNQCLVKVSEYGNLSVSDISNVNFTIAPAFITVTAPNGTENYSGCSVQNITWNRGGTTNNVKIEYSLNGGGSWNTIISSVANTGSYSWNVVPNTPSNNCLIRITDVTIPATTDVSNAPFNILANTSIIVTSPNGGESWQVGGPTHNITWAASGTSTNLTLEYSINNGSSWISIASVNAASGSYTWTIPNNPSTTCLVRLTDQITSCKFDVSDAVFTIAPPTHVITVTAPNTAVTWYVYQSYNITWTSSYVTSNVKLEYSTDNGALWTTIIASTPNSGSYSWTIPNTPSNQCLVRVSEVGTPAVNDVSDVNFTIASPVITVTSPNTGVTWYVGNTNTITWNNTVLSGPNVKIDYSIDNGSSWLPVVASVANTNTYNWVVPNTPSTTCLVKVSDATTPTTFDVSNVTFTIASPWILVGSPNGGEILNGCSVPTITWTKAGTTNNVKIEYTLNGGTSWVTIVSSTANSGSYAWNVVPNSPSTNCFIRITDVSVPTTTDMSNLPFTISQNTAIVVNTPNGGEVWQVGGPTHAITWAASGTSASLTLEYSIDNGVNWIYINTVTASAGSYTWTIPNNPSTNCLVRLTDPSNTCKFDVSDAVFTISPPTPVITVTTPNTALTWYIGTGYTITWTSAYITSPFVTISYSTDAGLTWNTITASTNNTGSYAWTAIAPPSTQCLVKVSEYGNPSVFDISNVNFTIANPVITVTSPNGSESYNGCSTQTITWTRAGTANNVKIEYSLNGGSSWSTIVASTSNTGSYSWSVVPNTTSNNCLIRITDVTLPAVTDISNAPFTITPNTSIIVTAPNGGEVWQVGGPTQNITWAASGTSASLILEYSTNNGGSWTYINTVTASAGTYAWTIPNTPSTTCLVRLYDASNSCKIDQSDAVFTISPPSPYITVTAPNTPVTWYVGSAYNITWNSGYLVSTFVKIDYSIDNGATWISITPATNNTGSYSWTAINPPSTTCLVKVSDYGNLATYDISNVTFTIAPALTVTAPNGTEVVNSCTSSSITWFAGGCSGNYKIELSTNGGSTWSTVVASYAAAATGNCSYAWSIPNTPSTNCLVRVSDVSAPTKIDQSNATFTIAPAIQITFPNFGGTFTVGSVQNITWSATGVSNFYNIDYSIDNGATWISIIFNANITSGTYAWTVPNNPSTTCLVRVIDNVNSCKRDQSDNVFTISSTAPAIAVTSPNGGENWQTCSTQSITWTASGTSGLYNLDYSINGGTSWVSIATNYSAAGSPCSYTWTIPNTTSANCLVKVTDAGAPSKTDQSNLAFTISSSVPLIASGTATICNGSSTPLSASGATTYAWLPATGLSNASIANPTASPSTTTTYAVTGTAGACSATATVTVTVNPIPNITSTPSAVSICSGASTTLVANGGTSYSWSPATGLSNANIYNPVANPSSTTTYTVTGTNAGCTNTATAVVTVNPIPTITVSGTTPICAGTSSNLSASGATTYSWSPATGLSNPNISNPVATPAGTVTYTVTGTASGCSGTAPYTINVLPSPTVTASGGGNICAGSSTNLTASGAVTYSWSPSTGLSDPNISNPVASPSSTTTYTVTGTTSGCSRTATVTVSVIPTPIVSISGGTNICNGTSTALTASGATTYSWSPVTGLSSAIIANPNAYPSTTTTYTVTGTTSSCTGTNTITITVNPAPSITITGGGTFCAGSSTNLNATGAVSYSWSPGTGLSSTTIANPVATPAATTTYTVTGTGAGCSSTATVTITIVPIPVVTVSGTGTICDGSTTNLTASGATTYSWSPATGLSSTTVPNPVASPNSTITYTITGTTSGCIGTTTKTITVNPVPVTLVSPDVTICNGTTTNLTASGATTYSWSPSTGLSSATIANPVCSTTTTRTYTVTGTSLGCSSTAVVTVTVTPLPAVSASGTATICAGASTTITASGTATTYSWLPSASLSNATVANPVATPATTTTYTVTGTANGCSSTATVTITVNPIPTISISGPSTICTGTSAVLTASGASTYVWSPGTGLSSTTVANPTANPTSTITYTINGTALSCTGSTTFTLNVVPALTISATGSATICSGTSTPLDATGAVSYVWSPAAGLSSTTISSPIASPTTNTTYVVTGTSGTCTDTAHVIVNVITSPTVSISGTTNICNGNSTTLTASGATTYSWSPATGLSNSSIANPVANPTTTTTYTVTGTTGTCSGTAVVTITVNPIPVVTAGGTTTICSGLSTPLTSSGATTYAWLPATGLSNPAIANPTATPASTTTYTVTGTTSGCSASATVAITVNPTPTANAGSPATICLGGSGTTLNASGGTTYAWLPATGLSATNISNPVANPTSTTTYTVTVGTGSCSATASVTITVNTLPSVNAGTDVSISCSGSTTLNASGGTTYSWSPATGLSNPNIANPVANPGATTSYTVTGTTGGCSGTDVVVVTVSPLTANAGSNVTLCAGESTVLTGSATGVASTYAWSNAQRFGSTGADRGYGTAADAAGYHYITGQFTGTVTFGGFTLVSAGGTDMYVVKLNSAGVVQWAQKAGGTGSDYGQGIAVDASGNVYVTGDIGVGTSTFGSFSVTSGGSLDMFVAKYNSAGTCQWVQRAGAGGTDEGYGIAADASGVWVTGTFVGSAVAFGSVSINAHSATDEDGYVAKYNTSGVCLWAQPFGSVSNVERGTCVSFDAAGNAYIGAIIRGTCNFGSITIPVDAQYDAVIAKYNSAGVCQWAKYGGISGGGDYARAIVTDGAGNSYLTGSIGGTATFGALTLTTNGSGDAFIVKYNSAGVEQWGRAIGGTNLEAFFGIAIDPSSGNIYAAGYSASPSVTIGSSVLTSFGTSGQVMLGIFDNSGTGLFGIKSNSVSPGGDYAYAISADGSGNAYIAGQFASVGSTTATFGSTVLTTAGVGDILDVKLATTNPLTYSWSPATGLSSTTVACPTATPASTTNYVFTVTSGACVSSSSVVVTVAPIPVANAGSNVTICTGTSTTLTATGGTTYSWLPATGLSATNIANPVANPTTTTTYTVTVSNGGSCTSTASVTVTVSPFGPVSAGSNVTIGCGSTTTLAGSGGTTYVWSPSTGLSNPNIANPVASPSVTTTYTVTASTGSCSGTASVTVTVSGLAVDAGLYTQICAGSNTILNGTTTGGSSTQNFVWARGAANTVGGTTNAVAADASGNSYTTGYINGTATFGAFSLTSSSNDIFVAKYNSAGVCQWAQKAGSTSAEWGNGISVDGSGNVYVTGFFRGTSTFGSFSVTSYGGGTDNDIFIAKYNSSGVCQWVQKAGSTTGDIGYAIKTDAAGNSYISGSYSGAATFGSFSLTNSGTEDIFIAKYNTSGVCQWAKNAGSTSTDRATGITLDASGNPVATGFFTGTVTFGSTTLTALGGAADYDIFVTKLDPAGNFTWTIQAGSTGPNSGRAVSADGSGNLYITGTVTSTMTFGSTTLTSTGTNDIFIAKLNSSGVFQWAKMGGGGGTDQAEGIFTDAAGTSYITGSITGTTATFGTVTIGGGSGLDALMVAYNNAGTPLYGFRCGGSGSDMGYGVALDGLGNIYVGGSYNGTATFGPNTLTSSVSDGFVAQIGTASSATYSWSPPTGLSATNIASPTATPTTTTTYTLTATSGTCSVNDTVTIAVLPAPTANAGSPVTICAGSSTTLNATGGISYSWSPSTGLSSATIANPVATPASTTTYTVTVSNGGVCSSTASVTVTVNPIPTANAGSNVTIACGASTTLGASGGTTYSWSPTTGLSNPNIANPVCTPPYTTTYTVTVGNGSCTSTASVTITTGTLTANAGPDVSICTGNTTTLTGTSTGGGAPAWVNLSTSYNYSQAVATYTAITGGTVLFNTTSGMDDAVSGSVTIPTFKFNNVNYTNIYVSTNGFITFGATIPTTTNYTPISSTETYGGAISALGMDLNAATAGTPEIRYQQVGSEFVVQWRDVGRYSGTGTLDRLSFQIRLNTTTNQVNIVYATTSTLGSSTTYPQVGLRGANNTFAGNVNNRTVISSTGAWVNSTAGTSNVSSCYYSSVTPATIPANGTTFTWSLPSATTSYSWAPPTGLSATNIASPVASPTTTTTYTLTTTSGSCTAVDQVVVTVVNAASISAGPDATICAGGNTTLAATGGGTYSWSPATGLSATNIANPIATPSLTTTYTVTVSTGSCSFTDAVLVTVNPLPAQPGTITGSASVCPSSTNTYSISPVSGATSYTWTLPGGWSGTSASNSINATAGATGGTISVVANNACGAGIAQTLAVNINNIPAQPASITGNAAVCQGTSNTYSVAAVSGATSYTWTLPGGWSGTSTTNSISATAGASAGNITVTADNTCGISSAQTLAVIVNSVAAQPAAITGATTMCSGTAQTYSVAAVSGATSYTWTMPGGWSGTSTTTTLNATAGTTGGNITVTANNTCGSSTAQTITVIVNNIPAAPAAISGSTNICAFSTNTYSIATVSGATSYNWTLPGGWTGTSTTETISATADATAGIISVTAVNTCGTSTAQTLNVSINAIPTQPAAISGAITACSGSTGTYSVASVSGATGYTWTLPGGWTGTSVTNSISAVAGATGGTISVTADNVCGSSSPQTLAVSTTTAPAQPGSIAGTTTICEGTSQTYSITPVSGATDYTWTLPGDWTGSSTTETINATIGSSSGSISVTANNTCGSSTAQSITATVNPLPGMPSVISGNNIICESTSQTYSVSPIAGATSYTWTLPATWTGTSSTETITANPDFNSGNVMVFASNGCGNGPTQILGVTVQTAPQQPVSGSSETVICDGSTATYTILNDLNATSYTWTLPANWTGSSTTTTMIAIANTNGGVVSVVENNSCGSSLPLDINVVVNPLPTVSLTSLGTVCDNDAAFTLSGGSPSGGTYSGTGVSGGDTFTPTLSGAGTFVITYSYSDANSCSNSDTASIQVDLCTGVAAEAKTNDVKVYPNPFSEFTTISIGKAIELNGTEIHVFDAIGKEVMIISDIHSYEIRIDRKDLRDGMYFFRVINNNHEISTGKMIIE